MLNMQKMLIFKQQFGQGNVPIGTGFNSKLDKRPKSALDNHIDPDAFLRQLNQDSSDEDGD